MDNTHWSKEAREAGWGGRVVAQTSNKYPVPHDLLMEYGESCLIVKQCEDMESLDLLTTEQKAWGGQCLMVKKLIERIAELEYKSNNEGLD